MKNISKNKKVSIICGAIVLLVAILFVSVSYFRKEIAPNKETGNFSDIEKNEEEQKIPSEEVKEDNLLSDESNVTESLQDEATQPSKNDVTESSQKEEESQEDTFDNIFDEKSETTNDSTDDKSEDSVEGDSNTGDVDVTQKDETKENLEESEDTSTGYGPIS